MNYPWDLDIQSCTSEDYMYYGKWDLEVQNLKQNVKKKKMFFLENPIISNMNDHCDKQDSIMYLNEDPRVNGVQIPEDKRSTQDCNG